MRTTFDIDEDVLSDRQGERAESRSAPGRRRARACGRSGEGAGGPAAAEAVCKRIRHAVKPFA